MAFTGVPWLDAGMAVGQIGFGIADAIGNNSKFRDMLRQSKEEQARINRNMAEGQQRTDATSGNLQTAYNVERNADKANMSANIFLNTLQGWRQEKMGLESALASEKANYGNIKSQIRSGWDIAGTALGQGASAASGIADKWKTDKLLGSQMDMTNAMLKNQEIDYQFDKSDYDPYKKAGDWIKGSWDSFGKNNSKYDDGLEYGKKKKDNQLVPYFNPMIGNNFFR
jgi:hypothetical protein